MRGGWIKYHRKLLDNGLLRHPNANAVFCWLLLTADDRPIVMDTKFGRIPLKAGQVVTGRKILADKLSQSEQNIRTALKYLANAKSITIQSTNEYSVITVINFSKYQSKDEYLTNEVTKGQPSPNQALTTDKELEEPKEQKKNPKPSSADADPLQIVRLAQTKEVRDYWHSEFEKRFKRKAAYVPAKWIKEVELSLLAQLGSTELKRRADNCLQDGYKTSPRYIDFLKNNEDFATLRRFVIKGEKGEYDSKRGKHQDVGSIVADFAKAWGAK